MHERKNFIYYEPAHTEASSSTLSWKEKVQDGVIFLLVLHFGWMVLNAFLP